VQEAQDNTKKKKVRYKEQDSAKVAEYEAKIAQTPPEDIAYVDETGIDKYVYREYGRSLRGEKVYGKISGKKYKRTGIVAGKCGKEVVAPLEYNGTMDHDLFEYWFENMLLKSLPKGKTIVMDNASFHRKKVLYQLVEQAGCTLIFLPPYSPELNLIENFWNWLKQKLKKLLPLFDSFDDALFACFQVR